MLAAAVVSVRILRDLETFQPCIALRTLLGDSCLTLMHQDSSLKPVLCGTGTGGLQEVQKHLRKALGLGLEGFFGEYPSRPSWPWPSGPSGPSRT